MEITDELMTVNLDDVVVGKNYNASTSRLSLMMSQSSMNVSNPQIRMKDAYEPN